MSTKPIRFGILGTAKIASNRLIPAIREARNATVLGVASENTKKVQGSRILVTNCKQNKSATDLNSPDYGAFYFFV